MAEFARIFSISDVGRIHKLFQDAIRASEALDAANRRRGLRVGATTRTLLRAYGAWQRQLDELADVTAREARLRIRARIAATRTRPDTRVAPHLRDAIFCRPASTAGTARGFATGEVGIAEIARLDKVVNPASPQAGPYWMAQEFGSTKQIGRIIRGYFFGPGYSSPEVPRAQYAGGGGPHPIFVSAQAQQKLYGGLGFPGGGGKQGGVGGFGTIQHPIRPRHFIRDGGNQALADWRARVKALQAEALRELSVVTRMAVASVPGPRRR